MTATVLDEGIRDQFREFHRRLAGGMPRAGWKICINDRRVQKKLGLEASFVGFLDGSRVLASGDVWPAGAGSVLGVEPEFAIRFRSGVRGGASGDAIRAAIAGVAPAIEVVDWQGAKFDLATLAASASFHAGFVVGPLRELAEVRPVGEGCPLFRRGDEVIGVPDPDLVPADLAEVVAHVAAFLDARGEAIEAGDWLLCGACTNPARVEAGQLVEAGFPGLGTVSVRFSSSSAQRA